MFSNWGKQALAYSIGSNIPNNYISYCAIGSGSGTVIPTQTTLINEVRRVLITGSPDFSVGQIVTFQADFNSAVMSGTTLTEFAFLASGPALVGSIWQRECFGSIVFDGTLELQLTNSIQVF